MAANHIGRFQSVRECEAVRNLRHNGCHFDPISIQSLPSDCAGWSAFRPVDSIRGQSLKPVMELHWILPSYASCPRFLCWSNWQK